MSFWRLGFAGASSIDTLLVDSSGPDAVSLEQLLDEDDLLQECKVANPRLLEFLAKEPVVKRLLAYVVCDEKSLSLMRSPSGTVQYDSEPPTDMFGAPLPPLDEKQELKYPYLSAEVLMFNLWSVDRVIFDPKQSLLDSFWEYILDQPTSTFLQSPPSLLRWTKVNSAWLSSHPVELLTFFRSKPHILRKWISHLGTSADLADLFIRMVQSDAALPGSSIADEVLSTIDFIPSLLKNFSPKASRDVHANTSDLLKSLINLSSCENFDISTTDTANEPSIPSGPGTYILTELACQSSVQLLMSYMNENSEDGNSLSTVHIPTSSGRNPSSSLSESISVIVDLIRRNNSDFAEKQILNFRKSLIEKRDDDDECEPEEKTIRLLEREPRVISFEHLLNVVSENLTKFKQFLQHPRSKTSEIATSLGPIKPVTFERFRICELVAELLHCSNMQLHNRSSSHSPAFPKYDVNTGKLLPGQENIDALEQAVQTQQENSAGSEGAVSEKEADDVSGVRFKRKLIESDILPTIVDLLFDYPWNTFFQAAVVDIVRQILKRDMMNKVDQKVCSALLLDSKLTNKIVRMLNIHDGRANMEGIKLWQKTHIVTIVDSIQKSLQDYPSSYQKHALSLIDPNWNTVVESLSPRIQERENGTLGGAASLSAAQNYSGSFSSESSPSYGALSEADEGFPSQDSRLRKDLSAFRLSDPPTPSEKFQQKKQQQSLKNTDKSPPSSSQSMSLDRFSDSSDKFSRYLAQQVSNSVSSKVDSASSSEDEVDDDFPSSNTQSVSQATSSLRREGKSAHILIGDYDYDYDDDADNGGFGDFETAEKDDEEAFDPFATPPERSPSIPELSIETPLSSQVKFDDADAFSLNRKASMEALPQQQNDKFGFDDDFGEFNSAPGG